MNDAPAISDVVASHVLWHFGRGGYEPGGFTTDLITLIARADPANSDRLALGFPDYVAAVTAIKHDPDGTTHLQNIAKGDS